MILNIKSKYLILPVNTLSAKKEMCFKINGEIVYRLNVRADNFNPDFNAYIDVSRFIGCTAEICISPEMEINFRETDDITPENLYDEPMRPQIHFSTKNGWINDPNGLIYLDGVYHMFYQYNPTEPAWDNMHWGHAESRDLIHWEEKMTALFPDERGTMFSGCAVYDENNLLGLGNDKKAAVLFYTTTNPRLQYMSYSTDNFKTILHYSENAVVPQITEGNRDPKAVFCDELGCLIMALYLGKDIYCIMKSDNLTNWHELQRVQLKDDNECPDIFPLNCGGKRKWIFMGGYGKYLVGNFEQGRFVPEQSETALHFGAAAYAGQSFSNLPHGRIVRIVWDRWDLPTASFCGQMGIPTEMKLSEFNNKYYLEALPVLELECIYNMRQSFKNVSVMPNSDFSAPLEDAAQLLKLSGVFRTDGELNVTLFGRTICFDFAKNEIKIGENTAPISVTCSELDITVIADKCSIELFADNGKIVLACLEKSTFMDRNLPYITIKSTENIELEEIEIISLNSVWK